MLPLVESIAVIASAIYGILLACRKEMDVVGVIAVAFAVAFGGGTLRDLCLDRTPLFWIANDHYVMLVMGIAIVGSFIPHLIDHTKRFLDIPDAVGMGLVGRPAGGDPDHRPRQGGGQPDGQHAPRGPAGFVQPGKREVHARRKAQPRAGRVACAGVSKEVSRHGNSIQCSFFVLKVAGCPCRPCR